MKIKIRALKRTDNDKLFQWINDPDIIQYTNYYKPISEMEQEKWLQSIPGQLDQHIFGIELKSEEKLIGTCGFYSIDNINRKAELRIKLGDKEEWDKGYASEALKQLIDFGFNDINLNKIWLKVLENNSAAIRIYEKAGFVHEGKLLQDMYIKGNYKNVIIMGLLR